MKLTCPHCKKTIETPNPLSIAGGKAKSPKRALASQRNGALGGRPKGKVKVKKVVSR